MKLIVEYFMPENETPLLGKPEFIFAHKKRYDGHFQYQFDDGNFVLGGRSVSKAEALVRLGVMPHNNALMNKVINALGERVLDLLRQAPDRHQKRANENFVYQTAADESELLGSWAMIEILSAIKPLEQLTGYLSDRNCDIILNPVKKELQNLKVALSGYFCRQLGVSEFSLELDRKLSAIITNAENKLNSYPKNESDQTQQVFQRDLLRTMMNDFEELQTDISIAQRGLSNLFSLANSTNTSATQKAYYTIQNHVYSTENINAHQLWLQAEKKEQTRENEGFLPITTGSTQQTQHKKQLDTANYTGIRQEDALFAACLLETTGANPAEKIDAAKRADVAEKEKIKKLHTQLKAEIDKSRGIFGTLGLFRDSDMENAGRFQSDRLEQQGFWSSFYTDPKKINAVISPNQSASEEAQPPSLTVVDAFAKTHSAFVYRPGDLFSATSSFSYEFGEYFSREMAAKHPGIAAVGFALPSAYMASIALHGIGVAPQLMHHIYTGLSKVLSVDGHLVDPNKITGAFATVTDKWLWLTNCHGTVETAIMTVFGGPKIAYLISEQVNKMLSGVDETTLSAMMKLFSTGNLDTQLAIDQARELLKTFLKTSMMLGFATGLGIGLAALPHTIPGAAIAHSAIEIFDSVQASTFAAVIHGHGLAELGALAQMTAQVKTSGLFLAKIMAVSHFTRKGHEEEDKAAIEYFKLLQQTATRHSDGGKAFLENKSNDPIFKNAKKILELNITENPMVKFLFGQNEKESIAFLRNCGVKETAKAPYFARIITSAVKSTPSVIAGFFTTTIGGIIGLPVFIGSQIYSAITGNEAVPDNAAARYLYKNTAKLLLGSTKIAATVWFCTKFFGQALLGFAARVGYGLKEAGATVIELKNRARAEEGNLSGYLGNQIAKTAGSTLNLMSRTTKLVGFVFKAASVLATIGLTATLILPLASLAVAGIRTLVGGGPFLEKLGNTLRAAYTGPFNAISAATDTVAHFFSKSAAKMKDHAALFEKDDSYSRAKATAAETTRTENATNEKPHSRNWFIRAKNALGSGLAFVRDITMRKLEHTLQVVAHKDEKRRMDQYRAAAETVTNTAEQQHAESYAGTLPTDHEPVVQAVETVAVETKKGTAHTSDQQSDTSRNGTPASASPENEEIFKPTATPMQETSDTERDATSHKVLARSISSSSLFRSHSTPVEKEAEAKNTVATADDSETPRGSAL